ncbi:MAG: hypothetical protein ACR2L9_11515 [Solirubrobacteraceae bacterium]
MTVRAPAESSDVNFHEAEQPPDPLLRPPDLVRIESGLEHRMCERHP